MQNLKHLFNNIEFKPMRRSLILFSIILFFVGFISCEKCSICTKSDNTDLSTEFCGKGKTYENQLDTYEKTGWSCTKK